MICLTCFRQTQWDPPSWDSVGADDAMDLESPLYEEIVKVRANISEIAENDAKPISTTERSTSF